MGTANFPPEKYGYKAGDIQWVVAPDKVGTTDKGEGKMKTPAPLREAARQEAAKRGIAMPDGSFPIPNTAYLKKAILSVGRSNNPAAAKAHIIKRAKALNATSLLPDDWK